MSAGADTSHRKRSAKLVWIVITFAVLWTLHTATQYFAMGVDRTSYMRHKLEAGFEPWNGWRFVLAVHVTAAIAALTSGGTALVLAATKKQWALHRWVLHRWLGRVYVIAVLISAAAGTPLAFTATGGALSVIGFLLLNGVWLATVITAYQLARRHKIERHRAWAIRSYSVTFANMTLHVLTALLTGPLDNHTSAYTLSVWLCWPLNLGVIEIVLRVRTCLAAQSNG